MQLHNLSAEEKGYLSGFVVKGKNTIYAAPFDGVAGGLLEKSIIYRASSVSNILEGEAYNLQPWAQEYIKKYPDLLKGAVGRPQTTEERLFGRK